MPLPRKNAGDQSGMTGEAVFVCMMRAIATNTAARGLNDDAAVITLGSETLIVTHDMMVESVHWLPDANPADVAWKLVATNLSDLAAKGAKPIGVMLGYMLGNDAWDRDFAAGLGDALAHYDVALLGGDTTKAAGKLDARSIGMTAIGLAGSMPVPARSGAQAGDVLYVTGYLGDAKAGYDHAIADRAGPESILSAFNRPTALIAAGQLLAPMVNAMMDVSDGLFLDASRMANASGLSLNIDLDAIPLSADYVGIYGDSRDARLIAASWGDDYQLLFAGAPDAEWPVPTTAIGLFSKGNGLSLTDAGVQIDLPVRLGFQHD